MGKTGQRRPQKIARIVSGAQTGVDRAALDFAISRAIDHGGWVPRGRIAEDGPVPAVYRVTETETGEYRERTERNVLDSDGTLIIFQGRISGGTALTRRSALKQGKPCLTVDVGRDRPDGAEAVWSWIRRHRIAVLNVAGPRESQTPGIYAKSLALLERVFRFPREEGV